MTERTYTDFMSHAEQSPAMYTYTSIGGVSIKPVLAGIAFGNLQAVSYSITREKAPNYTMGSPEPRGFSRGKRGIAGTMIFLMFDRHALLAAMRQYDKATFVSQSDEIRPGVVLGKPSTNVKGSIGQGNYQNIEKGLSGQGIESGWERVPAWYSDQIPPFNIVLVGVSELGHASGMQILGAEILNEGFGISIDDLTSEQQMTFVARGVDPWQPIQSGLTGGIKANSPYGQ